MAFFLVGLALATPGLAQVPRQPSEELLVRVLTALSRQPLAAAPFIERRISVLTSAPLESRGTLGYEPGGTIEKVTTAPVRESVQVSADAVTIRGAGAAPRVIRFDTNPDLAGYAFALRALLSGDVRALRQAFDIRMTGSFARWDMLLTPVQGPMKRAVRRIAVAGEEGRIRLFETTEAGGDVNELTLIPR